MIFLFSERQRENFEFLQSFITNIIHNTVKLQYSFIKKTKPTHKCIKNQITFNNRTQRLIVTPNFLKGNKIIHMFIVFKINQYSCLYHVQEQGN